MKKIAEGLQYKVYEKGQNRVLKIETTLIEKIRTLKSWGINNPISLICGIWDAYRVTNYSIKKIKSYKIIDWSLFGNPTFFKKSLKYEQDKVVPLGTYFSVHSSIENKAAIDSLVENIFSLWKYGMSDTVYNFTVNNGIDSAGKVILLDLGELTFEKNIVKKHIEDKKWLTQWSFNNIQDENLKQFVSKCFEENLTSQNLDRYWGVIV